MLHGYLYRYSVLLPFTVNNLRVQSLFTSVQITYELTNTAFIMENFLPFHSFTSIFQTDFQSLCKKCHLTKTLFQNIIIINCFLEYLFIRKEYNCGSCFTFFTVSNYFQRIHGLSTFVSLLIYFSLMINSYFKPG